MHLFATVKPPILPYKELEKAVIHAGQMYFRGKQHLIDGNDVILGTIYEIDTRLLPKLDKHYQYNSGDKEGSFFIRKIHELTTTTGEKKTAWVYFANQNLQL